MGDIVDIKTGKILSSDEAAASAAFTKSGVNLDFNIEYLKQVRLLNAVIYEDAPSSGLNYNILRGSGTNQEPVKCVHCFHEAVRGEWKSEAYRDNRQLVEFTCPKCNKSEPFRHSIHSVSR